MPVSNPFAGIESPFFWPIGLALSMEEGALKTTQNNLKFFEEVVKNEIVHPLPEWASQNKIVYDLHTFTLRDFSTSPASDETPTLVLPPYAGHTSTIADFHEKQSLIETLLQNGLTRVFCIDWRSATDDMKNFDIDNYLEDLHVVVCDLGERVNLIGLCQGGWMTSIYAARYPSRVAALVCAGSPLDTQAGNGSIRALANELPMSFYENLVAAGGGLLKGEFMLEGFKRCTPSSRC